MEHMNFVDITYDFRTDSGGKDPDIYSKTLKKYHQLLWSKPLPSGPNFELRENASGYLTFESGEKTFWLTSDAITNSYKGTKKMDLIRELVPASEVERVFSANSTIGGYIIFPGKRIDGKMTINGARGFNQKIADRFDLTLECIRRHYKGEDHPLSDTFLPQNDFFSLFNDFPSYVNFFHLQDLVNLEYSSINFFTPISRPFETSAYPSNPAEYLAYLSANLQFIKDRNFRIDLWVRKNLP